ncbi:hypothetical protein HAX54_017410 [Datura stramonium]|uniref:Uncharacterized protein n=1 Tax=Datura stramonium TaxID=4076 RepID=A0ABS8UNK2_DATST|nr:hypothetical protein [Datura stramonium]
MTDKSIRKPMGIVQDVLVKVGRFVLLEDLLDYAMEINIPIILGCPFLSMGGNPSILVLMCVDKRHQSRVKITVELESLDYLQFKEVSINIRSKEINRYYMGDEYESINTPSYNENADTRDSARPSMASIIARAPLVWATINMALIFKGDLKL